MKTEEWAMALPHLQNVSGFAEFVTGSTEEQVIACLKRWKSAM